jgi:hypothetical protein
MNAANPDVAANLSLALLPISRPAVWQELLRFDADAIVHRVAESLLAPEISLSGLDAHVAEQKLNLFQFATCLVTQACASAAEIVWGNAGHRGFRTRVLHHTPDDFRAKAVRCDSARFVYRPKDCSRTQVRGRYPRLQTRGHPCW